MSQKLSNKEIQKKRTITYFINAVDEILEKEGHQALTARNIASTAGFNVATLYNYFSNLKHLLLFSSIRYLNEYAKNLSNSLPHKEKNLEKYLEVWRLFSYHSYMNPDKYHEIFFGEFDAETINSTITLYYDIFPDVISPSIREYIPMLKSSNIFERDYISLQNIKKDYPHLTETDMHEINEVNCLIYQGFLYRYMVGSINTPVPEGVDRTMIYIKKILASYGVE